MSAQFEQDVIITTKSGKHNTVGVITLNRPKALNALSYNMIIDITRALVAWQDDLNIIAVFIRGNGDRAFCAGGDIKSLYTNGRDNPEQCMQFFNHEYKLNYLIRNYSKPYIPLLHGVTMGGGVGVSVHGSHRVATDNLIFAMPETSIGFFPDIGASHFLSRCDDHVGSYLGLTGHKINCNDAKHLKLIDYIVPTENYNHIFNQIINEVVDTKFVDISDLNKISSIIINYCNINSDSKPQSQLGSNNILNNLHNIAACFSTDNLSDVFSNLENYSIAPAWGRATLEILHQKSLSSLIITLELLKRGAKLNFKQCLQMEYGLAYGCLKHNDLYEGIRALLIDKDNKPKWEKINFNDYSNFDYESYFVRAMADQLNLN